MGCLKMPEDRSPPEFMDRLCEHGTLRSLCERIRTHALLFGTFVGITLGFLVGALLNAYDVGDTALVLIGFPGELFLRILRMLVLPLIISSIITGTTSLDPKLNGRVAMFTIFYFVMTSMASAIVGLFLANLIHPGHPDIKTKFMTEEDQDYHVRMLDTFFDLFRNALPPNIIEAFFKQFYTSYVMKEKPFQLTEEWLKSTNKSGAALTAVPLAVATSTWSTFFGNDSGSTVAVTTETGLFDQLEDLVSPSPAEMVNTRIQKSRDQMNGLGIIVFLMVFGMILSSMQEKAVILVEYFRVLDKIIMRLIKMVIWLTPLGVASLICERMASISNLSHTVENMGMYIVTVLVGLALHQFVMLPLLYYLIIRRNPYPFWWNCIQAYLTGFATDSSAAALPVAMQCMEDNNRSDPRLTRFVMPVGATLNMNGTAMFVTIATIFIAQMNDMQPTTSEMITIVLTATAASVATSATPSASLYLMIMTLSVLPTAPLADVGMLFIIDWFLDRCRTTNNIVGDCYAVAIVQHYYGQKLDQHRSELEQLRKDHTVPGIGLMFD